MKVYVYIDESGSIHKNSRTKYFAVGGYFTLGIDKNKIISFYKKENKKIKDSKNLPLDTEIKSFDMSDDEKVNIFKRIQDINTFCGSVMIFDKKKMKKDIVESNIFFNYAVKLLITDCIIPLIDTKNIKEEIEFILSVDNRNIRVGELNNLETYLRTEFCAYNYEFKVTYYDSKFNFGIQLADLIVNTFYNKYKDEKIVANVLPLINKRKFRIGVFPGFKIMGRTEKIEYTNSENN